MKQVRCQIFRSLPNTGIDELQGVINTWLEEKQLEQNPLKVVSVCQTEGGTGEILWLTISLFYEIETDPGVKK